MVINEELGEEVRVSIIATGFERGAAETPRKVEVPRLPMAVKTASAPGGTSVTEIKMVRPPAPVPEVVPEPAVVAGIPEPVEVHEPPPPSRPGPVAVDPPEGDRDLAASQPADLDLPAFMRRERRLFQ
jgi:cell division protein FtsZ